MTIRRQDSAHIFSVAESFSNYSQDQDPMSSFVIGTKITVLWCIKCYHHDSQLALVGCFVFSSWGSLYLLLWLREGISVEHKSTSLEDISTDNLPRSRPRAHHCWRVLASTESSDGHNPQGCLGYTHPGSEMCSICGNVFCAAECSPATGRS